MAFIAKYKHESDKWNMQLLFATFLGQVIYTKMMGWCDDKLTGWLRIKEGDDHKSMRDSSIQDGMSCKKRI